jgi:hypothetical protein
LNSVEAANIAFRGGQLKVGFQALLLKLASRDVHTLYDEPREILGEDFIAPDEIMRAREGIVYDEQAIQGLMTSLPSKEVLESCRKNNFMVVAGPPRSLSFLEVLNTKPFYVPKYNRNRYSDDTRRGDHAFTRNDKVDLGWLIIRKDVLPGSTGKTDEQLRDMVSSFEAIPNIAEVAWAIGTYKAVRDVRLLSDCYTLTSSITDVIPDQREESRSMYLGKFHYSGMFFFDLDHHGQQRQWIGVVTKRK